MLFGCPVDWFFAPLAGILRLKVANFTFLLYVLTVRPAAPEGNSCLCSSRFGIAVSCLQCGPECVRRGCAARVLLQCCEGRCKANGLLLSWINCILSKQASPPITRGMGSEHIRSNRAWRMRPSGLEDALRYLICYWPQSPPGLNSCRCLPGPGRCLPGPVSYWHWEGLWLNMAVDRPPLSYWCFLLKYHSEDGKRIQLHKALWTENRNGHDSKNFRIQKTDGP